MNVLTLLRERSGDYRCPACHRPLLGCDLRMLAADAPLYTVQVSCALCSLTFVVVLQVRERRAVVGQRRSAATTIAMPPITADELLDLHERLVALDGPITDLLPPARDRRRRR